MGDGGERISGTDNTGASLKKNIRTGDGGAEGSEARGNLFDSKTL